MTHDIAHQPPILGCENLHAAYGQAAILRGITFGIRPGETVGLMGRNGMGKSTLIRTMMGLVAPNGGRVLVDGRDAAGWPTHRIARTGIAYVPEGRGIFASLSVAENIQIAVRAGPTGSSEWTAARVLELFPRIGQRLTNRGDQLSGGEQQMLAIARALVTNPRLLILDEATEGLAPLVRDEIWRTIGLIRDTGMATLVVDKTIAAVAAISDRIVVIVKGQFVFEGVPSALAADTALMQQHLGV